MSGKKCSVDPDQTRERERERFKLRGEYLVNDLYRPVVFTGSVFHEYMKYLCNFLLQ